jgi:hypothetical protein
MAGISTTGPINFSNLRNEFGGPQSSQRVRLSEYYRNGRVTPNNTFVPSEGEISLGDYYDTFRTLSKEEVYDIFKNTNYTANRNIFFSKQTFGRGMETSNGMAFSQILSPSFRYATSVTGTYTWPNLQDNFKRFSWITVLVRNYGSVAQEVSNITYNGQNYQTSLISNANLFLQHKLSYVQINTGYDPLSLKNISVTYLKSSRNNENLQEFYVLPGKWNAIFNSTSSSDINCGSVIRGDFAVSMATRGTDRSEPTVGNYYGTDFTEVMRRTSHWYSNTGVRISIVDSPGNLFFSTAGRVSNSAVFRLEIV